MPEPCHYCDQPIRLTKDNYRVQHIQKNGEWVKLIWHTKCDPFLVAVTVSRKEQP